LSSIGFASILYAASEVSTRGWNDPLVLSLFGGGVLALVLFAVHELRSQDPIVDLRLFKNRIFTISSIVGWVSVLALFGAEFLMPLYLQSLRGLSPFETGLMLLPLAITSGIVAPIAGVLYDRIGARPLLVLGFALIMFNTWQLSQIKLDTSYWEIGWLLAIRGVGLGLIIQPTLNAALSVVSGKAVRRATSLVNASRQIFLSLGVALLASILQSHIQGFGIPNPREVLQGFEAAYLITFWAAVASFCLSLLTPGWPAPRKVIELPIDESWPEAAIVWDAAPRGGIEASQQSLEVEA
jgi:MFS transporter, DHA2 family, multidrug resistance protein